ncbi:IS4/IS5 family transposase [bacterium CPR1]|nr:IS4/IS5 family transposase [bacterium CPR1]
MVSLFDPDARPIRRGKLSSPVEFGYKAEMTQVEGKVISDYQLHIGNPNDATLAVGVVERHCDQFGKPPEDFATDRGYYSTQNDKKLEAMGVKRLSMPARGKLSKQREAYQSQPWFRRLQRFRAGCEGSISFLKRCCGWDRSRLRGLEGVGIFAGFGVFSHNLRQAHVLTAARQRRRKGQSQAAGDQAASGCASPAQRRPPRSGVVALVGPQTRAFTAV